MLDFGSLLLATALSGACLSGTLLAIWLTARQARFVFTMAAGILLLVVHVIGFWQYGRNASPWLGQLTLTLLVGGFFVILCSTAQYLDKGWHRIAAAPVLAAVVLITAVTASGYDGLGFVLAYSTVTALLIVVTVMFWAAGEYDRRILAAVTLLAGSAAVSFTLCALVLVLDGQWSLGTVPKNWAEDLNTAVVVACMTALGALTISLHHLRTQRELTVQTLTDPLTGLLNRRALTMFHGDTRFGSTTALAMFDLDHFKRTNDVFGHAAGDTVLQRFADVVRNHAQDGVECFRLGGEEFAVIMSGVAPDEAHGILRSIGGSFGAEIVVTRLGPLRSTVSVGICFGDDGAMTLDEMLTAADAALYAAKRAGRNRAVTADMTGGATTYEPARLFA
ncbi:GGDEF domain-containing protein [Aminobacter niigataensis]|uniref:GGDEF domain-containing protein n=1 Tax=Aminobacter niigataensis TaxID=83265 RepID=UPI0024CB3E0D|nr:GGDEF domain-containing protein [Aminobacter niigataensis]CAI2934897.1 Putative diguanylate cyclase YcdT [Aminobacter niigataensis]